MTNPISFANISAQQTNRKNNSIFMVLEKVFRQFGLEYVQVDTTDLQQIEDAENKGLLPLKGEFKPATWRKNIQ